MLAFASWMSPLLPEAVDGSKTHHPTNCTGWSCCVTLTACRVTDVSKAHVVWSSHHLERAEARLPHMSKNAMGAKGMPIACLLHVSPHSSICTQVDYIDDDVATSGATLPTAPYLMDSSCLNSP